MKLTAEQILSAAQGALRAWEEDGTIRLSRFTEEEAAMYAPTGFATKSRASAGIQMEFDTDADSLCLAVSMTLAGSRNFFAFEIYKDGERIGLLRNFEDGDEQKDYIAIKYPVGDFEGEYPLGTGMKRVRIVFPFTVCPLIRDLSLANATVFTPVIREKKILMYGDSITQGYDAILPSQTYAMRLGEMFSAHILNKGIGGERFNPTLAAMHNDFKPDFITSAYGTNDWNTQPKEMLTENCIGYHAELAKQYPDTPVFILAPIWRADTEAPRPFGTLDELAEFLRGITEQYENFHFIPGWDLVPHDPKYFGDKRLHPTAEGFAYFAENLREELKKFGI